MPLAGRDADFSYYNNNLSNYLSVANASLTANLVETTGFSDAWREHILALKEGGFDLTGSWDSSIDGVMVAGYGVSKTFDYGPAGSTSTYVRYGGSCIMDSYDVNPALDGRIEFTAHLTVTGTLTVGTYT
jgi:hypothetical protein